MIGIHKISDSIKAEKSKLDGIQESIIQLFEIVNLYENKDMVSVNDLNLVIEDVRESFQLFLNNTPRDNNEEIKNELSALKSEILALREIINNNKPVVEQEIIELKRCYNDNTEKINQIKSCSKKENIQFIKYHVI